jgi:hypothetical protein
VDVAVDTPDAGKVNHGASICSRERNVASIIEMPIISGLIASELGAYLQQLLT